MILAKMSIERPIMTTMILLVFVIFGLIAYLTLNIDLNPEVSIPYVTIQTIYPGAGPKEIEMQITKKIEDRISTISQIEMIESYSLDGASVVIVQFKMSKNIDVANQEVKDKVDAILNELPTDAKLPIIEKVDFKAIPIMDVVLSGSLDARKMFDVADKTLKDRFSQIEGVANVQITGGQKKEVWTVVDNKVAFENNISLVQLLQILKANNMNLPGGYFQLGNQEYTVRLQGEFNNTQTMNDLQVPTQFGLKKLQQFATVLDTGKRIRQRAVYFDNKTKTRDENIIRMGLIKSPDGNAVKVADAVYKALPDIKKQLPEGCNLEVVNDDTQYIKSSISDMMGNIYLGILFTSIVLFLFLGNIRTTFIIAVTMPTSIISTFMFIKAWGLTMNQMSLMGISVTIGVLVANSVVVIENIYRHKDLGKDNKTASYIGTKEVTVAVLASTLTNLIVFIPIANMSSLVGQFLKELALSATFATLFSLLYSFTLTPMLSALILPKSLNVGKISNGLNRFYKKWDDFYKAMLRIVLKNKWVSSFIILSSFALFMVSMMIYGGKLGFEFLPAMDDGKIKVEVELPEGYNLQTTAKTLEDIENRVKKYKDVKHIITNLGKKTDVDVGSNMARMDIQLVDVKQRKTKLEQYITIFVNELASIPNTKLSVARAMEMGGGSAPIEFYLLGQDVDKLEELKGSVIEKIKDAPGLINFDNSSRPGKPEITIYPQRDKLAEAGITLQELAFTLRASVEGLESSKYRQEGNEYDIIVNLSNQSVNAPEKIANITVVSAYGGVYRLSQLADVKFTNGYTSIIHRDKFTTIKFTGAPAEGVPVGNVTNEIDKRLKEIKLPSGYYFDWGGMTKMMNEMVADFGFAFLIAILLTYMLLAAILESFLQPVFILITIPLAMIGIVTFSYYTDTSLGITSLMGIIMLIGVVVNNAILMLDYTNQLRREEGLNAKDALIEACPIKLKAIIMSTLALILGMLPMALGIGDAGKEMRTPLGIVSIGGLVVSTIMTLFVIPAFYYVTSRKRKINIEDTGAIS